MPAISITADKAKISQGVLLHRGGIILLSLFNEVEQKPGQRGFRYLLHGNWISQGKVISWLVSDCKHYLCGNDWLTVNFPKCQWWCRYWTASNFMSNTSSFSGASSITPSSSVLACRWLSCCDVFFLSRHAAYLYPDFSTLLSVAVSSSPFLPRSPLVRLCFCWAAPLSPCNLRPCQSHHKGTLDLRLLFSTNPCALAFWCQVSVGLHFGCQCTLLSLLLLNHSLLQG